MVRVESMLGCILAAGLIGAALHAEELQSGLAIGAATQSIPVLDVTGPYKGQRICYVCEFQDDPNVLAFLRDTSDETAALIVRLDALYRRNSARGFRAVAVLVDGPDAKEWLENLDRSANLEIPLTVFRKGPADVGVRLFELNPGVDNTFLVTRNRFVVANVSGIAPEEFDLVAMAAEQMLSTDSP